MVGSGLVFAMVLVMMSSKDKSPKALALGLLKWEGMGYLVRPDGWLVSSRTTALTTRQARVSMAGARTRGIMVSPGWVQKPSVRVPSLGLSGR